MSILFKTKLGRLYHGDCMDHFGKILNGSVDMVICDLPYGITNCDWDIKLPLTPLWKEWSRVLKEKGVVALTAQQPFAMELVYSAPRTLKFRYELIWEKGRALGFLNAKKMPLRAHENILIFYRRLPVYNPQMRKGTPYKGSLAHKQTSLYRNFNKTKTQDNSGTRYPRSVLKFAQERRTKHPTEKPQAMFEWLIKTYTHPGDLVLDNCMGSGTTAAACEATGRRWIGMEMSEEYCQMIKERIERGVDNEACAANQEGCADTENETAGLA